MSIDYESHRIYEAHSSFSVQEHRFWNDNLQNGTGFKIQFNYAVEVTQIVAVWATQTNMVLSAELPSGISYTITTYGDVTSFTLNHLGTDSNDFVFWTKLPKGSFLRLGVDSAESAAGKIDVSVIAKPV